MPLLRYQTGDCVTLSGETEKTVVRLCGREKEAVVTDSGALIYHSVIDDCIAERSKDILLYKLQVSGANSFRLLYTSASGQALSNERCASLESEMSALLEKNCSLQHKKSISPGYSGKFCWYRPGEVD